jgi:hypothetical protein
MSPARTASPRRRPSPFRPLRANERNGVGHGVHDKDVRTSAGETDWMAGLRGLELEYPCVNDVFEKS